MARVVLHIGTHKTGSTAVQHAFAANRGLLARHGVIYPDLGRGQTGHHGLAAVWNDALAPYAPTDGAEAAWHALARRHARGPGTLVLSSEELGRSVGPRRTDFAWIRETLSAFEEIEVICLVRDQIGYAQSLYLEIAKPASEPPSGWYGAPGADLPSWPAFLRPALTRSRAGGLELDHGRLLAQLGAVLPQERIHLVPYGRALGEPHGAVGAVLGRIAPDLDPLRLDLPRGGRANVTRDALSVWAAWQASAPHPPDAASCDLARALLAERHSGPTTLYTRREIKTMQARFEPINARLAERLAGRDPTFALPWPDLEGALHRHDLDPAFWIELGRRLPIKGPARAARPAGL